MVVYIFVLLCLSTGWSNSSSLLTQRLAAVKLRTEMMKQMEEAIHASQEAQRHYQSLLSTPLPPSPLLADTHRDILGKEVGGGIVALLLLWQHVLCYYGNMCCVTMATCVLLTKTTLVCIYFVAENPSQRDGD